MPGKNSEKIEIANKYGDQYKTAKIYIINRYVRGETKIKDTLK
jgi:hypothetical protein